MSLSEFDDWLEFYAGQPFDDRSRFHRPAALVAHQLGRSKMPDLLKWLDGELTLANGGISEDEEPLEQVVTPGKRSAADMATMIGLGMKPPKKRAARAKGKV